MSPNIFKRRMPINEKEMKGRVSGKKTKMKGNKARKEVNREAGVGGGGGRKAWDKKARQVLKRFELRSLLLA